MIFIYFSIFIILYRSASSSCVCDNDGQSHFQATTQIFNYYGYDQNYKSFNKNCATTDGYQVAPGIGAHKLHLTPKKWNDARNTCIKEGGHLAIIRSAEEDAHLQKLRTTNDVARTWLGLHDQFTEGDWVSVLDEPLTEIGYAHWTPLIPNDPDNYGGQQNCAALIVQGMDDLECFTALPFICKISLKDCTLQEAVPCIADTKSA